MENQLCYNLFHGSYSNHQAVETEENTEENTFSICSSRES